MPLLGPNGQPIQPARAPQPPPRLFPENYLTPEIQALAEELADVMESNDLGERILAQSGGAIDPNTVAIQRFIALMDVMWPTSTEEGQLNRLRVELLFQQRLAQFLPVAQGQSRQKKAEMEAAVAAEIARAIPNINGQGPN